MPTNLERMKYVLTKNPKLLVKAPGKILRKTRKHFHPLKSLQLQINKNKRKRLADLIIMKILNEY